MSIVFHAPMFGNGPNGYKEDTIGNSFTNINDLTKIALSMSGGVYDKGELQFKSGVAAVRFDPAGLAGSEEFSISCWVKPPDTNETEGKELVSIDVDCADGVLRRWAIGLSSTGFAKLYIYNCSTNSYHDLSAQIFIGQSSRSSGQPSLIVLKYSRRRGMSFMASSRRPDGSMDGFQGFRIPINIYDNYVSYGITHLVPRSRITLGENGGGTTANGTGQFFNGISDVRVYNHWLSDHEENELKKRLLLHYSFDIGGVANE